MDADLMERVEVPDLLEMDILALDLALTATGWAGPEGSGVLAPPSSVGRGMNRLAWIRDRVMSLAEDTEVVVLEGYSFGHARGASRQHATGELGGVVRLTLFEAGIPTVEVAPASLKRYATGKGNAPKEAVLAAAIRRLGFQGHDHNEADAWWLRAMAQDRYGLSGAPKVPKSHQEALKAVEWPEIPGGLS